MLAKRRKRPCGVLCVLRLESLYRLAGGFERALGLAQREVEQLLLLVKQLEVGRKIFAPFVAQSIDQSPNIDEVIEAG